MTEPIKDKPPRIEKHEVHRLSENGDGAVQWGVETDLSLSEVKTPGCFQLVGKHGFKRHDTIKVVCLQFESVVTHAILAVTGSHHVHGIEVLQLGESFEVEVGYMTPFERLGIKPTANRVEIDIAFRERSKHLHPDKGGNTPAMQLLNKAREEAISLVDLKERAA